MNVFDTHNQFLSYVDIVSNMLPNNNALGVQSAGGRNFSQFSGLTPNTLHTFVTQSLAVPVQAAGQCASALLTAPAVQVQLVNPDEAKAPLTHHKKRCLSHYIQRSTDSHTPTLAADGAASSLDALSDSKANYGADDAQRLAASGFSMLHAHNTFAVPSGIGAFAALKLPGPEDALASRTHTLLNVTGTSPFGNVPHIAAVAAAAAAVRNNRFSYQTSVKNSSVCQVCHDTAAGAKGAHTKYSCVSNGQCVVTRATRTRCQQCRFQKCVQLGMALPGERLEERLRGSVSASWNSKNVPKGSHESSQDSPVSDIPCRVCGAASSGFHFGAVTCEGCKGFFRRSIKERDPAKYVCQKDGHCEITPLSRNVCKACRYRKCLAVGMNPNGSRIGRQPATSKRQIDWRNVSSQQCSSAGLAEPRNARPNAPCNGQSALSTEQNEQAAVTNADDDEEEDEMLAEEDEDSENDADDNNDNNVNSRAAVDSNRNETAPVYPTWTKDDLCFKPDVLERMEIQISDAYLKELVKINVRTPRLPVCAEDDRNMLWNTMMKQFLADANAVCQFAKKLPFFNLLTKEDKLALVRTSMYQICLTQLSRDSELQSNRYNYFNYDEQERKIIFEKFPIYSKFEDHFQQMRSLRELSLDNSEYALYCALQLFSVDVCNDEVQRTLKGKNGLMNGIESISLINRIQNQIAEALHHYCLRANRGSGRYNALMLKLASLRLLTLQHQEVVKSLRQQEPELLFPDLYVEMFQIFVD